MQKLIGVFGLVAAAASASPAFAVHDRLFEILSMIDVLPTKEQLVAAGAGENGEVLAEIALDRAAPRYVRTRAASSLSLFDNPIARAALVRVIDTADDQEVRIQAIASIGLLDGKAAVPRLSVLLIDEQPDIRAAAVRALARTKAPEVGPMLAKRLAADGEDAALVRALIQKKLGEVAR